VREGQGRRGTVNAVEQRKLGISGMPGMLVPDQDLTATSPLLVGSADQTVGANTVVAKASE